MSVINGVVMGGGVELKYAAGETSSAVVGDVVVLQVDGLGFTPMAVRTLQSNGVIRGFYLFDQSGLVTQEISDDSGTRRVYEKNVTWAWGATGPFPDAQTNLVHEGGFRVHVLGNSVVKHKWYAYGL